jgi:hypothetical protein
MEGIIVRRPKGVIRLNLNAVIAGGDKQELWK